MEFGIILLTAYVYTVRKNSIVYAVLMLNIFGETAFPFQKLFNATE